MKNLLFIKFNIKVFFSLLFTIYNLVLMAQDTMYVHQKTGSTIKIPISTIDSITFLNEKNNNPSSDLTYTKSVADEYILASNAYSDYNLQTKAVNGGRALAIKSKSNTLFGGAFTYKNDQDPTFNVNKCPSQPLGGYPNYYSSEGGFIHIYNGLNIEYSMLNQLSPDKPAVGEFYYVCRLYLSTEYEAIMSGFGAPELKVVGNNTQLQFSNGDYKTTPNTQSFPAVIDRMETVIFRFVYENNQVSIYVTDHIGDNRLLKTLSISPTSIFRVLGIGTSSHPMTHDFFAYIMKFGSVYSNTQRDLITAELKVKYGVGKRPDKPLVFPTITYNGSEFIVNLNYVASSSGAPIDLSQSTIRWYHYDFVNAPSGNGIDKQTIIKTSNCTDLKLKRADYLSLFPTTGKKNEIAVDITCVDANGNSFVIPLTSKPFNAYY